MIARRKSKDGADGLRPEASQRAGDQEVLRRVQMNVIASQGHVVKQEAIIVRLTSQGHHDLAAIARGLLEVMNVHLNLELDMVLRLKAKLDIPPHR